MREAAVLVPVYRAQDGELVVVLVQFSPHGGYSKTILRGPASATFMVTG